MSFLWFLIKHVALCNITQRKSWLIWQLLMWCLILTFIFRYGGGWWRRRRGRRKRNQREMCLRLLLRWRDEGFINITQKVNTFPLLFLLWDISESLMAQILILTPPYRGFEDCTKRVKIIWGYRYLGNKICGICCSFSERDRVWPSATFNLTLNGKGCYGGSCEESRIKT